MEDTIRWTVTVSRETDLSLRSLLGQQGMKKGDLSKFIQRAVQKEILERTAATLKQQNVDLSEKQLNALVDEAVNAVRREMYAEAKLPKSGKPKKSKAR
jgi:Ribbon-helix-helix domain